MRLALLIAASALAGCGVVKTDAGGCREVTTGDGSQVEVCESAPREAEPAPAPEPKQEPGQ